MKVVRVLILGYTHNGTTWGLQVWEKEGQESGLGLMKHSRHHQSTFLGEVC